MSDDKNIQPINVANLQHSEDLLKVEDIMIEECKAKGMIGFRMTNRPATQESVTPQAYKYEGKFNPTKEELDKMERELRKKYATARGLSMFTTEAKAEKQANRLMKKLLENVGEDEAEGFMEENAYLVKFDIPASAGVSTEPHRTTKHYNFFPNKDIDVLDLMDVSYGYKKIDYDYGKDE